MGSLVIMVLSLEIIQLPSRPKANGSKRQMPPSNSLNLLYRRHSHGPSILKVCQIKLHLLLTSVGRAGTVIR